MRLTALYEELMGGKGSRMDSVTEESTSSIGRKSTVTRSISVSPLKGKPITAKAKPKRLRSKIL